MPRRGWDGWEDDDDLLEVVPVALDDSLDAAARIPPGPPAVPSASRGEQLVRLWASWDPPGPRLPASLYVSRIVGLREVVAAAVLERRWREGPVRVRGGRLEPGDRVRGSWRARAVIHLRGWHAVPLEVELNPWSDDRTELGLRLADRHARLRHPDRYFPVAHAVVESLSFELETRALLAPAC